MEPNNNNFDSYNYLIYRSRFINTEYNIVNYNIIYKRIKR